MTTTASAPKPPNYNTIHMLLHHKVIQGNFVMINAGTGMPGMSLAIVGIGEEEDCMVGKKYRNNGVHQRCKQSALLLPFFDVVIIFPTIFPYDFPSQDIQDADGNFRSRG